MIVKSIKVQKIPPKREGCGSKSKCKKGLVKNVVENFMKSSAISVELIDDEGYWANSNNFRKSFQNYLKNEEITSVFVTIRGNRVFLIKEVDV